MGKTLSVGARATSACERERGEGEERDAEAQAAVFMSVTGSTLEEAKQYLEMSLHDVDRAVELFFNSGGLGGGGEIRRNEAATNTNTNGAAVAGDLAAADSVRAPMNIQQDVVLREETTHSHRRSREEHERSMRAFTNFEGSRVVQQRRVGANGANATSSRGGGGGGGGG